MKKIKIFLFTLTITAVAFVLSGCIPGTSNSVPVVINLPSNWSYVTSMAIGNNIVLLGGVLNNASGAVGEYNLTNGMFSDLSSQMQSFHFQHVNSITFLNNKFYIAGDSSNGADFASLDPLTNIFTPLNYFNIGNFSTFKSISTDGTSILIGGIGNSPLLIYNPSNLYTFTPLNVSYNFEVNNVLWDGNEYLIDGLNQAYNTGVLYLDRSNTSIDVSPYLPLYTGALGAAGYNGQQFLIWSKNNSTSTWPNGYYQMLSFNPSINNVSPITAFATNLSIPSNGITGSNGWFVIGGTLLSQPYFVKYNLTGNPIDLSSYLPNNVSSISSVFTDGSNIYVAGNYANSTAFFEIVKGQL
ncbi:hypothetical protein [Athalassotoga sp.]|uniref:hypothetical protein n=1 Tax=Athalassotoga sp. TaxID=2022597 RepID=UPI003D08FA76